MQLEQLEAGKELDARIAKILGIEVAGFLDCWCPEGDVMICDSTARDPFYDFKRPVRLDKCFCEPPDEYYPPILNGHAAICFEPIPMYSTDVSEAINAAASRVEFWLRNEQNSERWEACSGTISGIANTPALAICRMLVNIFEK